MSRVTRQRIEDAICTLADLTTEEHESLDGATRDEIGRVIYALDEILDAREKDRR